MRFSSLVILLYECSELPWELWYLWHHVIWSIILREKKEVFLWVVHGPFPAVSDLFECRKRVSSFYDDVSLHIGLKSLLQEFRMYLEICAGKSDVVFLYSPEI